MTSLRSRRRPGAPPGLVALRWRASDGGEQALLCFCLDRAEDDTPPSPPRLTARELQVALAMVAGKSSAEIAREGARSRRTVENQVSAVFRKIGVASRRELVARWLAYLAEVSAAEPPRGGGL